jgi:hypothetical protein
MFRGTGKEAGERLKELRTAEGVPLLENRGGGPRAFGAALLAAASSKASAGGLPGGWRRLQWLRTRPYYVQDAKIIALRIGERGSPVPICTIVWCRPGMR